MKPKFLWTKIFVKLLFALLPFAGLAQQEIKTLKLTTPRIDLNGYRIDSVKNDTFNIANAQRTVMTAKAVYQLVKMNTGVKGDKGDPGIQGIQGLQGIQGVQGNPGLPGNKWLYGTGVPSSGAGDSAWFYVRSNGEVYEKTTGSIWTYRFSIKGATGDKGDPGTGVYIKGTLADSTLLPGSHFAGDAYLISGNLWVSNGTSFSNVGHIQGPAGTTGATGPQGAPGATGATGLASKWITGAGAPSPGAGDTLSIYLNKNNGDVYKKNTGSWVFDVNIKGPSGANGADGAAGATGATGAKGKDGTIWLFGTTAPSSGLGDTTNCYLNTTTGDVYKKTGVTTWTAQGNLQGPPGGGTGTVTGNEYTFTATGGQTAFTSPYGLPAAIEKITVYRNGTRISFTKSSNTFTLPVACDAGDQIFAKWID